MRQLKNYFLNRDYLNKESPQSSQRKNDKKIGILESKINGLPKRHGELLPETTWSNKARFSTRKDTILLTKLFFVIDWSGESPISINLKIGTI